MEIVAFHCFLNFHVIIPLSLRMFYILLNDISMIITDTCTYHRVTRDKAW